MKKIKILISTVVIIFVAVSGMMLYRLHQINNFSTNIKIEHLSKQVKRYKDEHVSNEWKDIQKYQKEAINQGVPKNAYGILKIPSINLELPIFKGSNNYTLSLGASTFLYDTPAGTCNFVLAGHTTPYTGVLLTNLHEIKKGARVSVETRDKQFEYVIDSIATSLDTYTTVEGVPKDESLKLPSATEQPKITLITCAGWNDNTTRLVVGGHLTQ